MNIWLCINNAEVFVPHQIISIQGFNALYMFRQFPLMYIQHGFFLLFSRKQDRVTDLLDSTFIIHFLTGLPDLCTELSLPFQCHLLLLENTAISKETHFTYCNIQKVIYVHGEQQRDEKSSKVPSQTVFHQQPLLLKAQKIIYTE